MKLEYFFFFYFIFFEAVLSRRRSASQQGGTGHGCCFVVHCPCSTSSEEMSVLQPGEGGSLQGWGGERVARWEENGLRTPCTPLLLPARNHFYL